MATSDGAVFGSRSESVSEPTRDRVDFVLHKSEDRRLRLAKRREGGRRFFGVDVGAEAPAR
jgi:hypothetical protein